MRPGTVRIRPIAGLMAVAVQEAGHGVPHLCISQPRSRRPPDGWKEAIYSTRHFLVGGWDVSYLLDSARIEHSGELGQKANIRSHVRVGLRKMKAS